MNAYVVSYDLRNHRDYSRLYQALRNYTWWAHVLESQWVVWSDNTATQVRDFLKQYIDGDDGLFVAKFGGEAAWFGIKCDGQVLSNQLNQATV